MQSAAVWLQIPFAPQDIVYITVPSANRNPVLHFTVTFVANSGCDGEDPLWNSRFKNVKFDIGSPHRIA